MAHSEQLVDRIRAQTGGVGMEERGVMDGLGFFVGGRMAMAVFGDRLCLRLEGSSYRGRLREEGVMPYGFAGRPVPGWLAVSEAVLDDERLAQWVELGLRSVT